MNRKVFLSKSNSKNSQSKENTLSIPLTSKFSMLPDTKISEELSLYQLYNNERDSCNKYRAIFVVNPICTNILFNMKTEVIKDEGSNNCQVLFDNTSGISINNAMNRTPLNLLQAVRDTEYSHPQIGGYTYHCGLDIFNNHMLRSKAFTHVNKYNSSSQTESMFVYNTIEDYLRDNEGNILEDRVSCDALVNDKVKLHLYQYDTVNTFYNAFVDTLKEKNGWYGFTNPSTIAINSRNDNIIANRMMLSNKSCEFIDMYPDRSLYSFTPKFNKFKNRKESNWDYCITYAFSSDTNTIKAINGSENGAIRCFYSEEYDTNGHHILRCYTLFKHTLQANDKVRLYYINSDGDEVRFPYGLRVTSVGLSNGEQSNRYFSVEYDSVRKYIEFFEKGLFYKKEENNVECEYYIKILKKIKKYEYVKANIPDGAEIIEYNVMPYACENASKFIKVNGENYALISRELKSDNNKLAFGENIYGDEISQIVFTDDIDVTGLIDNLGRSVTTLYLTILKRNKGYEKWYSNNIINYGDDEIEYSHCFGKLTGGIDLGGYEPISNLSGNTNFNIYDYNIHYLHNIDINEFPSLNNIKENMIKYWGEVFKHDKPKSIGDKGYTIDDEYFYGDVIEFSPYNYTESIISDMYYRFNTAQREAINEKYCDIWHDEIEKDDYDVEIITGKSNSQFSIKTEAINGSGEEGATFERLFYGNISPEGFYYKGNTPFKIKELSENTLTADAEVINYGTDDFSYLESTEYNGVNNIPHIEITFKSPIEYGFIKEDLLCFYNKKNKKCIWGHVMKSDKNLVTIFINGTSNDNGLTYDKVFPGSPNREYFAIISYQSTPSYARYVPEVGKFIWRGIEIPSELPNDSELFDMPYANGCFYIEKNVNIFAQRQDPIGEYGLSKSKDSEAINPMERYRIYGEYPYDLSFVGYMVDKVITCY